jgi:hypothetical protein
MALEEEIMNAGIAIVKETATKQDPLGSLVLVLILSVMALVGLNMYFRFRSGERTHLKKQEEVAAKQKEEEEEALKSIEKAKRHAEIASLEADSAFSTSHMSELSWHIENAHILSGKVEALSVLIQTQNTNIQALRTEHNKAMDECKAEMLLLKQRIIQLEHALINVGAHFKDLDLCEPCKAKNKTSIVIINRLINT